jgi:predicted permease
MDRRTRICLWVIALGLANFAAYIVGYTYLGAGGGDAMNGKVIRDAANPAAWHYYLGRMGNLYEVRRPVWIYSAVHSSSIFPTMAAVMLSMLTLAKDRIISAVQPTVSRGRMVLTLLAGLITLMAVAMTAYFIGHTVRCLVHPPLRPLPPPPALEASAVPQASPGEAIGSDSVLFKVLQSSKSLDDCNAYLI